MVDLQLGRYLALCFVPASDGMSHVMKGMSHFFTVAATSASVTGGQLASQATCNLRNFAFAIPLNGVPSGPATSTVVNQGTGAHELTIVQVADGKTANDVITWVREASPTTPPPDAPAGGMVAIAPGTTSWMMTNFRTGDDVALCYVQDPAPARCISCSA